MVNRRKFVATLGGCAVLPAVSRALERSESKPAEAAAGGRSRVDLNGQWERRIDGELYDVVQVPSSLRPSGCYHPSGSFSCPSFPGTSGRFYTSMPLPTSAARS